MPHNGSYGKGPAGYGDFLKGGKRSGIYVYGGNAYGRKMMIYGKPPRRWPRIVVAIVIIIIIIACIRQFACGGIFPFSSDTQEQATQTTQAASSLDASSSGTDATGPNATIQVSVVGDCTLGTDENFDQDTSFVNVYNSNGSGYFLNNVKRYFSDDQLTLCNFEGSLSLSGERADKEFAFRAPPKYANILSKAGVDGASVANNHSFDYGVDAYEDTKEALTKRGIKVFGFDLVTTYEVDDVSIGLFGINALNGYDDAQSLMEDDIKVLKKEGCSIIIGYFHWGIEGEHTLESEQVELAHAAIDAGCDLVVGAHPHLLQAVELYKNRYICYSLGNFCFGGNDNPMDYDTMIFQQTFTVENGKLILNADTLGDVDIIPCSVSSSSSVNNYQPTPLTGAQAKRLIKKLNGFGSELSGEGVEFETKPDSTDCASVDLTDLADDISSSEDEDES